jgi:hypothetical protein
MDGVLGIRHHSFFRDLAEAQSHRRKADFAPSSKIFLLFSLPFGISQTTKAVETLSFKLIPA